MIAGKHTFNKDYTHNLPPSLPPRFPTGHVYLSLVSLIILCSLGGVFVGCGLWYIIMRIILKRKKKRLLRQPTIPLTKEITIIYPQKHVGAMALSRVLAKAQKQPSYGDISLSNRLGGSSYKTESWVGDVYPRRRSSARQSNMEDLDVVNQLDESPCARLSKSKTTSMQHPNVSEAGYRKPSIPDRPARMWGPRANVKSRTGIQPPRTISRTISFWRRTSALALKYSDFPEQNVYGSVVPYGKDGGQQTVRSVAATQRRPLPQLPLLQPAVNENYVNVDSARVSHGNSQTLLPVTTISDSAVCTRPASRPMARSAEPLQLQDSIRNNYYCTRNSSSIYSRSEASSNSILYTPKSFLSEVSHLGMDVLRAAVIDVDLKSAAFNPYNDCPMTMFDSIDGRKSIAASTIITPRDRLGDPYTRVQKILERAYLNQQPGQCI